MHRPWKGRALAATALLTLAPVVACSDGDDTDAASDTTTAADAAGGADRGDFCAAVTAFGEALDSGGDPSGPLGTMVSTAPADIASEVADFGDAVQAAASAGDDSGFLADDFRDIAAQTQGDIATACGYEPVAIDAREYAFDGLPATLPAGLTSLDLNDAGAEVHELLLFRRADGTEGDLVDIVSDDPTVGDGRLEEFSVALPMESGDRSVLLLDLEPGDYVAVCFVPVGTTSLDDLGGRDTNDHRSQGMIQAFTVE